MIPGSVVSNSMYGLAEDQMLIESDRRKTQLREYIKM